MSTDLANTITHIEEWFPGDIIEDKTQRFQYQGFRLDNSILTLSVWLSVLRTTWTFNNVMIEGNAVHEQENHGIDDKEKQEDLWFDMCKNAFTLIYFRILNNHN